MKSFLQIVSLIILLASCKGENINFKTFNKILYDNKNKLESFLPEMLEVGKGYYKTDSNKNVTIGNFYISKNQITTYQFAYFLNDTYQSDTNNLSISEYLNNNIRINITKTQFIIQNNKIRVKETLKDSSVTSVTNVGIENYLNWITNLKDSLFQNRTDTINYKYWEHARFRLPSTTEWIIAFSCYDSLSQDNLLNHYPNYQNNGLQAYKLNDKYDIVSEYNYTDSVYINKSIIYIKDNTSVKFK